MNRLDALPDVEKTSLFGTAVHAVLRSRATQEADVRASLDRAGLPVTSLAAVVPSLEDVFLDVVSRIDAVSAA
jgi:hypothetical protein